MNLLSNAFKFTPAGGRVDCELALDGPRVVLTVSDTGPGIPESMRSLVFERFFQAEPSSTRRFSGTGLGLSIVKEFVELHGGTVGVTAAPGGGACFRVEVPQSAPAGIVVHPEGFEELHARLATEELRQRPGLAPRPDAGTDLPLVLVVEDNADMSALVAETLGASCRVVTAADGAAALEQAVRLEPELIVSDLMLPGMSGQDFLAAVRRQPELEGVPVLILTANADEDLRVELLKQGVQDWLTKPFLPRELAARVAGLIRDRRRARAALRVQQRLLLAVTEGLEDGVFLKDRDGRYLVMNSAAASILDKSFAEVAGKTAEQVYPPEVIRQALEVERAVLADGQCRSFELTVGREGRTYLLTKGPYLDDRGNIIGTTGLTRDITDQIRREEALRASNDALRRSNDDLARFAYAASHDLQEPLRMVSLFSELLQESVRGRLEPEAERYIETVVDSAIRMSTLIKDILAYSQVASSTDLPVAWTDCGKAIEKVLLNLKMSIEQSGASLSCGALPVVEIAEGHLVQVLQNLLSNAIRFRGPRPLEVHVWADRQGPEWIVSVRDNGLGIDPRFARQVFGLFKRLQGMERPGSGIGLALCQKIVERYGGRIWVESELGQGATFRFALRAEPV
jgi:PAS domain S-box-containing protein